MGTRADFYLGRGKDAEWLGSTAWDGYPAGFDDRPELFEATTDEEFRAAVVSAVAWRGDFTAPEEGWPWPWPDSNTTDYAYAFDGGNLYASCFGRPWYLVDPEAEDFGEPDGYASMPKGLEFPDMTERQNVRMDRGSGLIVVDFPATGDSE